MKPDEYENRGMDFILHLHWHTRNNIRLLTDDLNEQQLLTIPAGFPNNILWNMGHVIAVQQLLCYRAAGHAAAVDETFIQNFKKGSRPQEWPATPDIVFIREALLFLSDKMTADFKAGLFALEKPFAAPLRMVYGNKIANGYQALVFNNHHEAMHLGIIWQMRKLV